MKRLALAGLALIPTLVMLCCGAEAWSETPAPAVAEAKPAKPQMFEPGAFDNPKVCSTCH